MNRDGAWDLEKPDQTFTTKTSLASNALVDLDRNGEMELLRLGFTFSLLEVIQILLSREIDIELSVHRFEPGNGFTEKPWTRRGLEIPFSFETFRPSGFIPVATEDVNADGYLDLVSSGGGRYVEITLGGPKGPLSESGGRQDMATAGVLHIEDFDRDGLPDLLVFDPHNFDVPVQIARNLGALPRSRRPTPTIRSQ